MATEKFIRYRSEYKYQLADGYTIEISIKPKQAIETDFINLDEAGILLIKNGYAWDGPSFPLIDTDENIRASLVHDALYQLMRNEELSSRADRKAADQMFKDICKTDGISNFKASFYYMGLRVFGKPAASLQNKKVEHRAPGN